MKEMVGTAMTPVGVLTNGGEWDAQAEITIVTKQPKYGMTGGGAGAMAKAFEYDQFRFVAPADGLRRLATLLTQHADELDQIAAKAKPPEAGEPEGGAGPGHKRF